MTAMLSSPFLLRALPDEMLFDFHLAQYDAAVAGRRAWWEALTPERWPAERTRLSAIFHAMFGPFPTRCALEARTTRCFTRAGYRVEHVLFHSEPDSPVTANLYLPDSCACSLPAVVLACGHAQEAKAYPAYQCLAIRLVRRGMAVLCFDPLSQGERIQLWDYVRERMLAGFEHNALDRAATLQGGSVAGRFVWDAMRAVDYLLSRPEIDPARIAMAGHSGGGTQTTWAAAVDERLAAALPMGFITSIRARLVSREPADAEQNPPDMLKHGLEYADFLAMIAPKPVFVGANIHDFFPIAGTRETVQRLQPLWTMLGRADDLVLCEGSGDHGLNDYVQRHAADFLCRIFNLPAPTEDAPITPEAEETLWVTTSGQCITEPGVSYTVIVPTHDDAGEICLERLRTVLGLPAPEMMPATSLEIGKSREEHDLRFSPLVLTSEPGISVPGTLFLPAGDAPTRLVLYCHEYGFAGQAHRGGVIGHLLHAGDAVLAFDPRGIGLTRATALHGWWANATEPHVKPLRESGTWFMQLLDMVDPAQEGPYASEFEQTMTAQMLGRPLLGQRVLDVLQALRVARQLPGCADLPCCLAGTGAGALWSLYAAQFTDVALAGLLLHAPLASYRLIIEQPRTAWHPHILARNLLAAGDVPAILRNIAQHLPITLIDPAGAFRERLSPAEQQRLLGDLPGVEIVDTGYKQHPGVAMVRGVG